MDNTTENHGTNYSGKNAATLLKGRLSVSAILAIMLLLGLVIRLFISWLDLELVFQKCLVDDAYFYLGIARNMAMGNGATFDGTTMTNGFHPVFALILVPVFRLFPANIETPVHVALTILSLFNVLTGLIIIYLIAREITGRFAGLLAAFIWLFNPYVILISLNGVEVSIATFFISLCIYQYLRMRKTSFSPQKLILLGILMTLAILSRVDAVFIFFTLSLDIFYQSYRNRKRIISSLMQTAIFVATAFVLLSPWLLWNFFNFGTIRQISGVTLPNIAHNMYLMKFGTYFSLNFIETELVHLKVWMVHIIKYSGGIILFILLVANMIFLCRKRLVVELKELMAKMKTINYALLAVIFLVSFYALYFWGWHRPWYYLSVILIVTIYLGLISEHIYRAFISLGYGTGKQAAYLGLFLAVISLYFSYRGAIAWEKGLFPFQKQLYESAMWLEENIEENAKIGAMSAGIYGYMTRRTIDLAGVVNEDVYRAMRERRIFSYVKTKKIDYLADREDMIRFYSRQFDDKGFMKNLVPVKRFGNGASDVVVYRINTTD